MIEPVVTMVELPAGMAGPDPVAFEVRCFIVAASNGVVLVDTATPGSAGPIGLVLAGLGLGWSDVTDIVLTHRHFDHVGGLAELAISASQASLWAGADDLAEVSRSGDQSIRPVADGQRIGPLRVLTTPGHTPGHISLLHDEGALLVGDLVGSADGVPTFGPPSFTADPEVNARSLGRVIALNPDRILFSHGGELSDGPNAVRAWLGGQALSSDTPRR